MAQYRVHDPDELIECPYDRVHMVSARRFQYHLMKCRKNYAGKDFVTCPFNAKHEMPRPELRHHMASCPDKAMVEQEMHYQNKKDSGEVNMMKGCTDTPVYNEIHIQSNEDWDAELTGPVRVGPLYDKSYYSRVKFHDPTVLNKQQRGVLKDNRLTAEQKMQELALHDDLSRGGHELVEDNLRLPRTASAAAGVPKPQPLTQPQSSVFAYSIGRGRGRGMAQPPSDSVFTPVQPAGIGRGLYGGGAVGRGQRVPAPPPGFCVPNVNLQ